MSAELLTIAEVALRLRISCDTVYRLASSGKLPGSKVGRAWRFDAAVIQNLVAAESEITAPQGTPQHGPLVSGGWLESIVANMADAVWTFDRNGNLAYLNQQARQLLQVGMTDSVQLTRADLNSQLTIFAADGKTRLPQDQWPCGRALRGETVAPTELLLVLRNGTRNWVRMRSSPVKAAAGNIVGCVSILQNLMKEKQREHQLRLTELTVMQSPDAVFWVRPDGGLDYVNDRACQSLGYSREELLGLSIPDFDPDITAARWPEVWAAQKGQKSFHLESRHRTKQGRVFPVEILATYVEYEGVEYAVSHVRDMSSRRRADAQLKESEARFQRAIAGSRDGIWDWDILSGTVWYSPQHIRQLGYEPEDVLPKHVDYWLECLHPDDKERIQAAIDQHLTGVAPYDVEFRMRLKSGEYRWFRVKGQAFWDDNGRAVRMTGTTTDVTDQRRVLEVLERQRRHKLMLIEHTPAAVAMFDRQMRYIAHSRQWVTDYGLDGESLIGRSHYEVFPDVPQRWIDIHNDSLKGQVRTCKQDCFLRADGSEVWLEWAIHPWTDDDGEIGGIVMFTNVITQRIITERALEKARLHAEAANLAKSEFLANMSHEIRTPLTAILGFAEILKAKQTEPEAIDVCKTIERNGEHLLELINDILDLSKVEAGRIDVRPEICTPALVVQDVIRSLRIRAEQKQLGLAIALSPQVPAVCLLDVRRVRQILINLIGNAIKFTPQGSVTIAVGLAGDQTTNWLEFGVQDTGIGIPAEKMPQLFVAFSQIDSSTTRTQTGTGLGLCISRRLARLCGGDLSVESVVGRGSLFTLRLPLVEAVVETPPPSPSTARKHGPCAPAPTANNGPVRILVADDSSDNRKLLGYIFRHAKLSATFVENGQELVDCLCTPGAVDRFDVVLVDMQMPVLDGYSAVQRLRARGCPLPLIALTANAMEGDQQKCLAAGCDDFLTKPIDRQRLIDAVQGWYGHRRSQSLPGHLSQSPALPLECSSAT